MLTVLEAIKRSTDYLNKKGIESARLNSEILLANILNCKRLDLYLSFDRPLTEQEVKSYREFISRRGKHEPLQYITREVEFYGLRFKLTPNVLIPRPETELLVETVINKLKDKKDVKILDVGTGSGNIAIALAQNLVEAKIFSIDASEEVLKTAKENAALNQVSDRINFLNIDIKSDFELSEKFTCVISNPPYVSLDDYNLLEPELKVYEPRTSLTDNSNGLTFFGAITEKSLNLLEPKGMIFFEMAEGQYEDVRKILLGNNFKNIQIVNDYQSIERIIYGELN